MRLMEAVGIEEGKVITFIGCGGKTSAIEIAVRELRQEGISIIHTTTTKIYPPSDQTRPILLYSSLEEMISAIEQGGYSLVTLATEVNVEGKLVGIPQEWVDVIHDRFPEWTILVEGDGCKGKSIKLYGDHEPCVPICSHQVVIVTGIDAFTEESFIHIVHRPEAIGLPMEEMGRERRIALLFDEKGLISGCSHGSAKYLLLTKVTKGVLSFGREIGREIMEKGGGQLEAVLLADTKGTPAVLEKIGK